MAHSMQKTACVGYYVVAWSCFLTQLKGALASMPSIVALCGRFPGSKKRDPHLQHGHSVTIVKNAFYMIFLGS